MKLTPKQQAFADMYVTTGNATESYMKAYKCKNIKTAEANSSRTLRIAKVKKYIEEKNKHIQSDRIADMTEVKEYWSNTMRDKENDHKDRLKASELIAKTNGAFLDKVEVTEKHIVVDIEEDDDE